MAKSFSELVARTTTRKVRERAKARAQKYMKEMLLSELRKLQGMSQRDLAAALDIKQPSLCKLERQEDMQVSTLRELVQALGGELRITAHFPKGQTKLRTFSSPSRMRRTSAVGISLASCTA
jgi:DNA-binding XRE family transcriptional regulator